ncbi:MAG: hypothetical protein JST22_20590 [Bacteroidetes bacterium]|nr:hypothetical protein [Bacteroidota bacterium]
MNRVYLCTMVLLLALVSDAGAQAWVKVYGTPGFEYGYRIERTSDGGFYTAGSQVPDGSQIEHLWVVRLDSNGGRKWDSSYGPDGVTETMFTFSRTHDDGFIVGGFTGQQFSGTESAILYRGDSNRHVVWQFDVNYALSDHFHFAFERREGGYYFGGHTDSKGDASGDMWLMKCDSSRNKLWDSVYDGQSSEHAHDGVETPDGGCLLLGHTDVADHEKFWLVRVDSSGRRLWQKTYSSTDDNHDSPYRILATREGNYALIGGSSSASRQNIGTMWLLVVDTLGRVLVDRHFGDPNSDSFAWSGRQTADGGFILAGYTTYRTKGQEDIYVVKTTADGTLQWQKTFGGSGSDYGYDALEVADGFVVCGSTASQGLMTGGGGDLIVLKIAKPTQAPAAVTLIAPADGSGNVPLAPSLQWNTSAGTDLYRVQLSADSSFAGPFLVDSLTASTTLRASGLANNGRYWWRVSALNDAGWSPWSSVWTFATPVVASVEDESAGAAGLSAVAALPNPCGNQTALGFMLARPARVAVALYDMLGVQTMVLPDRDAAAGANVLQLDTQALAAGTYICRIVSRAADGTTFQGAVRLSVIH